MKEVLFSLHSCHLSVIAIPPLEIGRLYMDMHGHSMGHFCPQKKSIDQNVSMPSRVKRTQKKTSRRNPFHKNEEQIENKRAILTDLHFYGFLF